MENAPLRTAPWTFCTFRFLLWSWAFIRSCQISLLHFFTSKLEQSYGFLNVFILVLNFSKAIGLCQTLFAISARSFLTFFRISTSLSTSWIKLFRLESESLSSDSLSVPKILFRLPASSLPSSAWRLTLSYPGSDSPRDPFWHSFLFSVLAPEELMLIFCFFFLCLTCSSSSLSESDDGSELALSSSDYLPFLNLFILALEGFFFYCFTSQILILRQTYIRKKLKAII